MPEPTHTAALHTADVVHTGDHSGDSGGPDHTAIPFDCSTVPIGPRPDTSTNVITTEEDFDFDATGLLIAQNGYTIKGTDRSGNVSIVASGLTGDAAGIRVAPNGDFVYASPDDGRYVGVSRATGGSRTLMSGLQSPNSLEMSKDAVMFGAEFARNGRIVWHDLSTGDSGELGRLDFVNGMTLSMDEQTLYLLATEGYWSGNSTLYALDRLKGNDFGNLREVVECPTMVTSVTVDVCGNLYIIAYNDGRLFRYSESTGVFELLDDLGAGGWAGFSAIRFSPGLGGFSTTAVYATNRARLFEVDVGVEGRHVLH